MATLRRLMKAQLVAYVKKLNEYLEKNRKGDVSFDIHYNILIMYIISLLMDIISVLYGVEIFADVSDDKEYKELGRREFIGFIKRTGVTSRLEITELNKLLNVRNMIAHDFRLASKSYYDLIRNIDTSVCFKIYHTVLSATDFDDSFKLNVYYLLKDMFADQFGNIPGHAGQLFNIEIDMLEESVFKQENEFELASDKATEELLKQLAEK